jgi:hypothetical protein
MEEVVHEVTAHPKLREPGIRIAHSGEITSFKAMECLLLAEREVISAKKPSLGFGSCLFAVTIEPERKYAVRDKVRNGYFGWSCSGDGRCRYRCGAVNRH